MHDIIFVPLVLFLVIVAPTWLVLHYRYKSRMVMGLGEKEHASMDLMLEKLDMLAERIATLEDILDAENPEWQPARRGTRHEK